MARPVTAALLHTDKRLRVYWCETRAETETHADKRASSNKLSIIPTTARGDPTKKKKKKKQQHLACGAAAAAAAGRSRAEALVVSESNE